MAGRDPYYSHWPYSNQSQDKSDQDEESGRDVRNSGSVDSSGSNYYGQGGATGYGRGADEYARYLSQAFARPFSGSGLYDQERSQSSSTPDNEISQSGDADNPMNNSLHDSNVSEEHNDASSLSAAIIEHSLNRSMRIQEELEEAGRRELERSNGNISQTEGEVQRGNSNLYADVNDVSIKMDDHGKTDPPVSELSHVIEDLLTKPVKKLQDAKQFSVQYGVEKSIPLEESGKFGSKLAKESILGNDLEARFHSWLQPLALPTDSNLTQNTSNADHFHLETLHLLMSSFRGKVHAELEESFSALLERSQSIRTDVLSMLEQSISELESRLTVRLELGDQRRDLKDVEARRAQHNELISLRSEIQRIVSHQRGRVDEVMQRLEAMDRAFAQMKLVQEQLKDGTIKLPKNVNQGRSNEDESNGNNGVSVDGEPSQELVLRLEKLVVGLEREISHTKAALERKLLENHSQLLRAQGVFAQLLENEEKSQQERDQLIRDTFSETRSELEQYLDAALVDSNSKHAALREQVAAIESAQEEFASQLKRVEERPDPVTFSDLRALDSEVKAILIPTAAQTRILTKKLDALTESFEEAASAASLFSQQNAIDVNTPESSESRQDRSLQANSAAFLLQLGTLASMAGKGEESASTSESSSRSSAMLRAVESISRQRAEFELKWGARWGKIEAAVGQLDHLEKNSQQSERIIETLKSDIDASLGSLRSDLSAAERRLEGSYLQIQKRLDTSLTPSALIQTIEKDVTFLAEKAAERVYAGRKSSQGNAHETYGGEGSNDIALKALTAVQNSLAQISSDNRELREALAEESKKRREEQASVRDYVNRELSHHLRLVNESHEADRISWNRALDSLRMQIDSVSTSEASALNTVANLKDQIDRLEARGVMDMRPERASIAESLSSQSLQTQVELQSQSIKMLKDSLQSALNRAEQSERTADESASTAARAQSLSESLSERLSRLEAKLGSFNFADEGSLTTTDGTADVAKLRESVRLEVAASMQKQTDNLRAENENLRSRVDELERQWLEERTARLAIEETVSKLVDPSTGMAARLREVEMTLTPRRSYLSTSFQSNVSRAPQSLDQQTPNELPQIISGDDGEAESPIEVDESSASQNSSERQSDESKASLALLSPEKSTNVATVKNSPVKSESPDILDHSLIHSSPSVEAGTIGSSRDGSSTDVSNGSANNRPSTTKMLSATPGLLASKFAQKSQFAMKQNVDEQKDRPQSREPISRKLNMSTQSLASRGQSSGSSDDLYIDLDSTELSDAQSVGNSGTMQTKTATKLTQPSPSPQKTHPAESGTTDTSESSARSTAANDSSIKQANKVPLIPKLDFSKLAKSEDVVNRPARNEFNGNVSRMSEHPSQDELAARASTSAMFDDLDLDDLESTQSQSDVQNNEGSINSSKSKTQTEQKFEEKSKDNDLIVPATTPQISSSSRLNDSSELSLSLDETDPQLGKTTLLERLDASRKQRNSNQMLSDQAVDVSGKEGSRRAELNNSKESDALDSSLDLDSSLLSLSKSLTPNRLTPMVPQRPNRVIASKPQIQRQQVKPIPPVRAAQSPLNSSSISEKSNSSKANTSFNSQTQDVTPAVNQKPLQKVESTQKTPRPSVEESTESNARDQATEEGEDDDEFDLDVNSILY